MKNHEKFIKSKMNPEEEKKFLNRNFTILLDRQLKDHYQEKLKDEYNITRLNNDNDSKRSNGKFRIYALVGSIAATFILALIFWPSVSSPLDLSKSYVSNDFYENKNIKRGNANSDLLKSEAIISYNKKDFDLAKVKYAAMENISHEDQFFYAMSLMYNDELPAAISKFENLKNISNFKYEEEVNWFLALSYIQNNQVDQAKLLLDNQKQWKKEEAKKILNVID